MKYLTLITLCLFSFTVYGQQKETEFDGHTWQAPYTLPTPEGWGIERFLIPINFAPEIPYKGVEDIRFAPGWAKAQSDDYWTYAFLWYLDGSPKTNVEIIAGNLKAYYTGLTKSNSDSTAKLMPVTPSFKKAPTDKGDLETYAGTIAMTDYMQQNPITLNCIVHLKRCPDRKTFVFHELSPKPFTHPVWSGLNQLWLAFKCKKD